MSDPTSHTSGMPPEIPAGFFDGLPESPAADVASVPPGAPVGLPRGRHATSPHPSAPIRALILYDLIIDDIVGHPDTKISETAKRLGKSPSTISLVMRSDFFRARWLQRRDQLNEEIKFRITNKMATVVEKSLDATMDALKTRANIPLPVLDSINKNILDRLGYAPSSPGGGGGVTINNNTTAAAASAIPMTASPEGLSAARDALKALEQRNASLGHRPGNALEAGDGASRSAGQVVEGEATRISEVGGSDVV